jgi:hypothetical protein
VPAINEKVFMVNSSRDRASVCAKLCLVAHDVDDDAMGIPDKKSPDAPGLVGQGIDDRMPLALRGGVAGVDVGDLDADIRMRLARVSDATTLIWAVGLDGEAKVTIQPMSMAVVSPKTPS